MKMRFAGLEMVMAAAIPEVRLAGRVESGLDSVSRELKIEVI